MEHHFAYLPSDELMASAGYTHTHLGRYYQKAADGTRYAVSFFSQSDRAVLQSVPAGGEDWQTLAARVVVTDGALLNFLAANSFPVPEAFGALC